MNNQPTITIIGCGYVGLTTAAILANCGVNVRAIEINPKRLDVIKQGRSFFYEEGIDPLIDAALKSGTLTVTDSYEETIPGSSVVFSCVGTPDNPDGSSNLAYVFGSAEQAAKLMEPGTIFVQKSTVPVGTGEKIENLFKESGKDFPYVSNPEFLREGTGVSDTLWFDRIVVGSDNSQATEKVVELYKAIETGRDEVANLANLSAPKSIPETQYLTTGRNSAELIKVTANAFLALKISFANSIAKLADRTSANITEVMDAVGADRRIGRAFLNAGRGYGGGCFPKDVSGLIRSAEDFGVNMEIMDAATEVNDSMPHYIVNKAEKAIGGSFEGKSVAILGLAFKAGTSDVRRSPAIVIANTLLGKGAHVQAYDPEAMEEAREDLDSKVVLCENLDSAIKDVDYVFVATDWSEFKNIHFGGNTKAVIDCMNCIDAKEALDTSTQYIGVGKN